MNTREMLQALTEDSKREAVMMTDGYGENCEKFDEKLRTVKVGIFGVLKWTDTGENLEILVNDKRVWKIIEPPKKLKEMIFGEAYWHYWASGPYSCDFKSVLTGKDFRDEEDISREEFMGLWTVEGIYEEEE